MTGSVIAIYIAPAGAAEMESLPVAEVETGRGIVGDRYYAQLGTFSKKNEIRPDQEITLIESEEIDRFNGSAGLTLGYGAARRNVITRGVRLNDLVGQQFQVGTVSLEVIRLCEPCPHLASLVSDKVLPGLVHRAGLRARILSGGSIKPSDVVTHA